MKKVLSALLLVCLCLSLAVPVLTVPTVVSAASTHITMIVTNPAENCSNAMNINFHADLGYTNCYVQYTEVTDSSWASAKTQTGTYVTYGASSSTNPFYGESAKNDSGTTITQTNTFLDYSVTLSNLKKETKYMYRIYDGSAYSDTYYFKTAGAEEWSFVVTGDFHEYHKAYGGNDMRITNATKAVNAAISLATQSGWEEVEHIVGIGDIVAWGVDYNQWTNVYETNWIRNYSFANTLGNHDAMDSAGSKHINDYNAICANYPLNGYGSHMGTAFYYIYNNVLFIFTNYLDRSSTAVAWATNVVQSNAGKYKYSVLVNHYPATSKYSGGFYSTFWNAWSGFCDENKIDLVLAGDHHVYMRTKAIRNDAAVSNYSASNPDGTVYIAADSSDGDRGSSTDVVSSFNSYVASNYYRYNYSSSSADITAIVINVGSDCMTTKFVYYENKSSASHPSFKEGTVSGHSYFYYGDTSYVYPSDHGYTSSGGNDEENPLPAATKNYLSAANGGQYMYYGGNYPGGSAYYSYAYYGDNGSQGGSYMTGNLNDGVYPANADPGSSETNWAVYFTSNYSANGTPVIYLKLSEAAYLNKLTLLYRVNGNYGYVPISSVAVSTDGSNYLGTAAFSSSSSVYTGSNYKLTLSFNDVVQASYIKLTLGDDDGSYTRMAIGEIEVWGDTVLPEPANPFELIDESEHVLDEKYVTIRSVGMSVEETKAQFKCDVSVLDVSGNDAGDTAYIGTGYTVVRYSGTGEVLNSVTIVIPGDLSGDGNVNTTDLVIVRRMLTYTVDSELQNKAADVASDDVINTTDFLMLRKHCDGSGVIY